MQRFPPTSFRETVSAAAALRSSLWRIAGTEKKKRSRRQSTSTDWCPDRERRGGAAGVKGEAASERYLPAAAPSYNPWVSGRYASGSVSAGVYASAHDPPQGLSGTAMRKSMHSAIRLRPPAATAGGGSVKPASALAIGMAAAPSTDCRARRACPPGLFGRGLMRSSSLGVPKGHRGPGAALAGRRGGEAIRTVPGPSLADLSSCVGVALLASYSVRPGARAASGNVRRCESGKACGGRFRFPSRGRVAWAWWLSAIRLNNSVEPFGAIEELHSLWKSWRVRLSLRRSWSLTFCRPTACARRTRAAAPPLPPRDAVLARPRSRRIPGISV
jgi:hypothetical protein